MVRKLIYNTALMMLMAIGLVGCRELPLIGDLAGQWQIEKMTTADGEDITVADHYYCFYRHTAQLTAYGGIKNTANMTYDNPSLALEFPDVSPIYLAEWGVAAPEGADAETRDWVQLYYIDRLDDHHLVMTTAQGVTITLRKY